MTNPNPVVVPVTVVSLTVICAHPDDVAEAAARLAVVHRDLIVDKVGAGVTVSTYITDPDGEARRQGRPID